MLNISVEKHQIDLINANLENLSIYKILILIIKYHV